MKQIVAHKKLGNVTGILTVLGLVAALLLLNFCIELAGRLIGATAAAVIFWILGILLALWVYRVFIQAFCFEITPDTLNVSRSYGKRKRFIEEIYLHRVRFVGSPEEAKKREPSLRAIRCLRKDCPFAQTAVIYECASGRRMLIFQPNEELLTELKRCVKGA